MSPANSVCDLRYSSLPDLDEHAHNEQQRGECREYCEQENNSHHDEKRHQHHAPERRNSLPSGLDRYESNGWFISKDTVALNDVYKALYTSLVSLSKKIAGYRQPLLHIIWVINSYPSRLVHSTVAFSSVHLLIEKLVNFSNLNPLLTCIAFF